MNYSFEQFKEIILIVGFSVIIIVAIFGLRNAFKEAFKQDSVNTGRIFTLIFVVIAAVFIFWSDKLNDTAVAFLSLIAGHSLRSSEPKKNNN